MSDAPEDRGRQIQTRIAANVRAELARAKMNPTEAATKLGMHPASMRGRLAGDIAFTAQEIVRLAAVLRVSPASLIDVDAPQLPAPPRGTDPGVLGAEALPES